MQMWRPDDKPTEASEGGLDPQPEVTRYAAQFALALIGYFLVGMWTLLLIGSDNSRTPAPSHWAAAAGICVLGICLAVVLRLWLGWRGFFAGALTGTLAMLVIAGVMIAFLHVTARRGM